MIIKKVRARKIRDSREDWTIEVEVNGCRASSPSGKSTGKYESKPYYKSLDYCVKFLNKWKDNVEINSFWDLKEVERIIRKRLKVRDVKKFGGNALFAFESAILKALARAKKKELWEIIPGRKKIPVPVGNAVGGGVHSSNFKVHPVFQEFLIIPREKSFKKNYMALKKLYKKIGKILRAKKRNDEGAWQTSLDEIEILRVLRKKLKADIGIDVAASSFYKKRDYKYRTVFVSKSEQIDYMNNLVDIFGVKYLEDPVQEEDFDGFSKISNRTMVVGDDLIATQINRLKRAIKENSVNAMIIKPNQNGSLLEVRDVFEICKKNKIKAVISHRSGETMDNALADYAVGFGADYIKTGIYGEVRQSKLDRLARIEKDR
ncbi:hypothetical protein COU62_01630 [Candidatus Pacearchaeota archaeon CG10_big_fil_rev_8_21_14_0_10_35_219]|nr:hypothetical protein [Candidatus Pacearchaeota archaeon]OIO43423.1 MAG: hypothetical protein AUJ63_00850 [Candidatus Pacearchaeota archaeon CG1_02_35_32]PIO08067.1 MAG: hypothetical protein COU62_01630 [Candidatus Pacearchaeota archaeon CG10_big_fil_rev_8_21_14_0_10_35_219]PIY81580.1 MAG: hypothetical protein COY79_02465 [Candidatus Pacearchaeota archaeon CG_4_10_14_0_8_um_filter_35_169]PIZ78955.1 MAG: hypothetical protein COY00_04850 [Candidatus Pacearchaeota archaeon CG_4_10_14_0_2_um_filt